MASLDQAFFYQQLEGSSQRAQGNAILRSQPCFGRQRNTGRPFPTDDSMPKNGGKGRVTRLTRHRLDG